MISILLIIALNEKSSVLALLERETQRVEGFLRTLIGERRSGAARRNIVFLAGDPVNAMKLLISLLFLWLMGIKVVPRNQLFRPLG